MFQKMMAGALIAGVAAGLLAAVLHLAFVQNLILLGEQYETGELVHFQTRDDDAGVHDHGTHAHASPGEEPGSLQRNALTVGFTVLLYVAYGMLLTAGFGIAAQFGHRIAATQGVLWGLAGFAAFQLAPSMGLAPELPGTVAADLASRQVWWWSTVVATGAGVALLAFGRTALTTLAALALLALPHVLGAPMPEGYHGLAPTELGATFAARVLGAGLVVWVALGWLAGRHWDRSAAA